MREHRYRALVQSNNKKPHWIYYYAGQEYPWHKWAFDYKVIIDDLQNTGLKDKNGKEIWEGDVLKYVGFDDKEHSGVVVFYRGGFMLKTKVGYSSFANEGGTNDEVIGNRFENADLLKGK